MSMLASVDKKRKTEEVVEMDIMGKMQESVFKFNFWSRGIEADLEYIREAFEECCGAETKLEEDYANLSTSFAAAMEEIDRLRGELAQAKKEHADYVSKINEEIRYELSVSLEDMERRDVEIRRLNQENAALHDRCEALGRENGRLQAINDDLREIIDNDLEEYSDDTVVFMTELLDFDSEDF